MKNLLLAFALFAVAGLARADESQFQFSKEVKVAPLKQEDLMSIVLDTEVFAATQERLADIRLRDGEGKPVPSLLRKVQTTRARSVRSAWPARQVSAQPLPDGGFEVILHLDAKDPRPTGLSLMTPLRNFEQRVRVETPGEGPTWEPIVENALIFDYSRYMDVRSDSVSFPETAARHFRIVIEDVTLEQQSELMALTRRLRGGEETERIEQVTVDRRPFRIDHIEFWRMDEQDRTTGEEKTTYPVAGHRVEYDKQKQQTIVYVDTRRQPLTSLELETSGRNFSRHAAVEIERAQGVKKTWEKIGEGTLSRVDFKDLKREKLAISFAESRHSQYRIVIDDRDSPPLEISGITAEGDVYEVVYLAAPDRPYRLLYGSADAEPAAYDTAPLQEMLNERFRPAQAELGPQMAVQGGGGPSAFKWSTVVNNPLLLGTVITLLVVALGWGLYRAVKRMEKLPSE